MKGAVVNVRQYHVELLGAEKSDSGDAEIVLRRREDVVRRTALIR